MIILKAVSKKFITPEGEVPALQDIHLHVQKGEIFGIIGKSGAGKSTLIRCVNLLEKPSSGSVIVSGKELTALSSSDLRKARHKIGMIFQHFNLLTSRTAYQNIAFPLELYGYKKKEMDTKVLSLLELTQLLDKKNAYPSELSGGQKQRLAIARALADNPHVLLSDEATSALDPETTYSILNLLKDIRQRLNITILLITHEMSVIKNCCDRVAILEQGKIIEENEVGEFFSHPKTSSAKNFIASGNNFHLPLSLAKHITSHSSDNSHPVWQLRFLENTATQPVIGQLINQFHLRINILQGTVEYVKNHAMGIMIIAIDGEKNNLQSGLQYLKKIGVQIEVMGYVPNDIIPFS